MNRYPLLVWSAGIFVLLIAGPVQAQGFYASSELGMNFAGSLATMSHDTDRASVCDEYINPLFMMVNSVPGWAGTNCTGPNRGADSVWENEFDSAEGVLFGAAVGYRIRDSRIRAEIEYFYRNSSYDESSEITVGSGEVLSKTVQEIVRAEEHIGGLDSHNIFLNAYLDFPSDSRFTPYVGIGLGAGFTGMDFSGAYARDLDPARIATGGAPQGGEALPNVAEIRANLAGTTTTESARLDDRLFGYQLLLGMDYEIDDSLSFGIKARWVDYDSFRGEEEWDQLRSHPSNLRLDGSEPVVYDISSDDMGVFGLSAGLKYSF